MIIVNQDDTGKGLFYINKGTIVLMQNEKKILTMKVGQ